MKDFKKLYDHITEITKFPILRPVDLNLVKDTIMETKLFDGVIVFNVVEDMRETKTTLFRPGRDKFNTVVNIHSIQTATGIDSKEVLMINCMDDTIIRNEDE